MGLCRIKKELQFVKSLVTKISTIITNCNTVKPPVPLPVAKNVSTALEYETDAAQTDVVTLTLDGFILYLYAKAYNTEYPVNPTLLEQTRLRDIYKTLEVPFPTTI